MFVISFFESPSVYNCTSRTTVFTFLLFVFFLFLRICNNNSNPSSSHSTSFLIDLYDRFSLRHVYNWIFLISQSYFLFSQRYCLNTTSFIFNTFTVHSLLIFFDLILHCLSFATFRVLYKYFPTFVRQIYTFLFAHYIELHTVQRFYK